MILSEVFLIGQRDISHQYIAVLLRLAGLTATFTDTGFDIIRNVGRVDLLIIGIRAEYAQHQIRGKVERELTVCIQVGIVFLILYGQTSQRVIYLVCVRIFRPCTVCIPGGRQGRVERSGGIECFLVIVHIVIHLLGTEHAEFYF